MTELRMLTQIIQRCLTCSTVLQFSLNKLPEMKILLVIVSTHTARYGVLKTEVNATNLVKI